MLERERARAEQAQAPAAPAPPGQAGRQKPGRQAKKRAEARTNGAHDPPAAGAAETGKLVERGLGDDRSAGGGRGGQIPPLELEPFSDEWVAWYAHRRSLSEIDRLNDNDAVRGIVPPLERRARERVRRSGTPRAQQ